MYGSILVPLDGSPLAEQVFPSASRISLGMGIPIRLMQVFHAVSEELADPVHGLYKSSITAGVRDEAIDYLNSVKRRTPGAEVTGESYEGDATAHIIEEAEKSPNSLIAMSTHGRSGITRWLMGSVTDKVLHHTKNPMLIVRARGKDEEAGATDLETIIVPVDGSSLGEEVIPHVAALASALDLKVTLLRATGTAEEFGAVSGYNKVEGTAGLHFQSFESMAKEVGNQAIEYMKGLEDTLHKRGVASVDHRIIRGPADEVIVDLALETSDNMVAMTTHGRSGPARWTLGSVTDQVARYSGDPVLVVRNG